MPIALVLLAGRAGAGDEPQSPGLTEAIGHYRAQRYGPAARAFEKENEVAGRPWLLFNIAECYRGLYNQTLERPALQKARDYYARFLQADPRGALSDKARTWQAVVEAELARTAAPAPAPVQSAPSTEPPRQPPAAPVPAAPVPAAPPSPHIDLTLPVAASTPAMPHLPVEAPTPLVRRWWVWTAGAAVVVGTVAAIFLATRTPHLDAPQRGDLAPQPYDR